MEAIITSASNPAIKQLRKLATSSKARREANTYVAEGIHLARSFLGSGQLPLRYAYAKSAAKNDEVAVLIRELEATGAQQVIVADSLFESLASVHAATGIFITFSPARPSGATLPLTNNAALLDDVQDPGNLGTILRTAAAVGIGQVLLSPGCASPWSPKALRAGMGAQFGLNIHEAADLIKVIKAAKIPVLATALAPGSQSLYNLSLNQPLAWLFGNEGQGVSAVLAERATTSVTIPQVDSSVESLNVAAAAAVCLYEQYRQNIS